MTGRERIVNWVTRGLLDALFRIDKEWAHHIPKRGGAIMLSNHTSIFEGPMLYVFIQPRKATAMGKREAWDNPIERFFMNTWNIIPVDRGKVDRKAITACFRALKDGSILGIAPEGTRARDEVLQEGFPGATLIAAQAKVPIYPLAHWGFRAFGENIKRLRKTRVHVRIGRPFVLQKPDTNSSAGERVRGDERRQMTQEMMYQIARLLPPRLRGPYSDLSQMTERFIRYV